METPKPTTQNKKEDKKGGVPTLSDATQTLRNPAFKVRDLSARTLVERFKQFRKKDLAFILAGLGVLFTAPMAERYLMSPTNGSSDVFKEGWGFRPGQGGLGAGGSPFDTGENGFATGNQIGENGDIITPANFRDPSSLILGPEAEAQPPATTSEAPASGSEGSNWKNALAEAGGNAAKKALGRAGLPMPPLTLSKNMLSGLAGLSPQGGGEHYSLPPVGGGHVPNGPNVSNSLGAVKANPNLKGVGPWSETGNGSGSIEALKTAGGNAASQFSNPSAAKGLENAAAVQMPTANPNRFGSAGADKGLGNNSVKMNKNLGESLAFMAAKMNMQKAIDLQWKLAEKKAMMWPNIEEKALTDMVTKPLAGVEDAISNGLAGFLGGPAADTYSCHSGSMSGQPFPGVQSCDPGSHIAKGADYCIDSMNSIWAVSGKDGMATPVGTNCHKANGGSSVANSTGTDSNSQPAIPEITQSCKAFASDASSKGNATPDLSQIKAMCGDLKSAESHENDANSLMNGSSAAPTPKSGYNYDSKKSPVRGFALNPMASWIWAVAYHAPISSARAQGSSSVSVTQDLQGAYKDLKKEISGLKNGLDKVHKDYGTDCNTDIQNIAQTCTQASQQGGVDEKGVVESLQHIQNSCFPAINKDITKMLGDAKTQDADAGKHINSATTSLSTVKTDESNIQDSQTAAAGQLSQMKDPREIDTYGKIPSEIQYIYSSVTTQRKNLKSCLSDASTTKSQIQSDYVNSIKAAKKELNRLIKTGTDPETAPILIQHGQSLENTWENKTGSVDFEKFNSEACNFKHQVNQQFRALEGIGKGLANFSKDSVTSQKPQCPASVTAAVQTASQ